VIRVLIADDQPVVRQGLRTFLELHDDIEVVGEAEDGEQALAAVSALAPDVVLMDLVMPRLDGVAAIERLRALGSAARVIVLTSFLDEDKVLPAVRAGAAGYLLKDAATGELELALRSVMRGESWLSPAVSRQVVEGYVQRTGGDAAPEVLTARQREVLRLVAGGKSTKEIAFLLNLSVKTVETHRAQIMDRLGIRDVAGLVRYALRTGLVPPDA
jgi:DNA-binding NarL/FixJ family response regulator